MRQNFWPGLYSYKEGVSNVQGERVKLKKQTHFPIRIKPVLQLTTAAQLISPQNQGTGTNFQEKYEFGASTESKTLVRREQERFVAMKSPCTCWTGGPKPFCTA